MKDNPERRMFIKKLAALGVSTGIAGLLLGKASNPLPESVYGQSGSGANGQVTFWTGTSTISGDNNLFWDNTNKRLGIGTSNPQFPLQLNAAGNVAQFGGAGGAVGVQLNGTAGNYRSLTFMSSGATRWSLFSNSTAESGSNAGSDFQLTSYSDAGAPLFNVLFAKRSTGNVGIGTGNPAYLLDVAGTVHATTFLCGDLGFKERNCAIDGQQFKVGDKVDLIVRSVDEHGTKTVPIHADDTVPSSLFTKVKTQ